MKFYEEKAFTDDELIARVMDKEEIKNLIGRRAYYYANNQRRRELDELWVNTREYRLTASYGRNWGYYVGMDSIVNHYVIQHTENQYRQLETLHARNPEVAVNNLNLGYGTTCFHEVTTPMIYIAGDGRTARGLWYVPGHEVVMVEDGPQKAYWTMDNMAADFVRENGQWKIWHLVVCSDFYCGAGEDFSAGTLDPIHDETDPFRREFGRPDVSMIVHNPRYNTWDNYPPMPEAYDTYTLEHSLAPEGHPNYGKEEYQL